MTSRGEQCGKSVHDIRQTESSQADDQWRCRTTELNQLVVCEQVACTHIAYAINVGTCAALR